MKCPACDDEMHVVQVDSHYSTPILVNQCKKCGGVWFDADELYRISPNEAEKIDSIDLASIKSEKKINDEPLRCPHDSHDLAIFRDPNFPQKLIVESCPACGGFWFNCGEFTKLKEFRVEKAKERTKTDDTLDPELEDRINKMLVPHSSQGTYDTLAAVGKFLSSPVQRMSIGSMSNTPAGLAGSALAFILRALIRKL